MKDLARLLVIVGLVVVQPGLALAVEHEPIGCAVVGKFVALDGRLSPGEEGATKGHVYFRAQGADEDTFVVFDVGQDGTFRAVLPRTGPLTESFRYQIALIDASGRETREASNEVVVSSQAFCDTQGLVSPEAISEPVASLLLGVSQWGQAAIPEGFLETGIAVVVMPDGSHRDFVQAVAPGGTERRQPDQVVASTPTDTTPEPVRPSATEPKKKSKKGLVIGVAAGGVAIAAAAGGGGGSSGGGPTPSTCTATENPERSCSDSIDNDCDNATDGNDSDCTVSVTMTVDQGIGDAFPDEVLALLLNGAELCTTPRGGECSATRSLLVGKHQVGLRLVSDTGASGGSAAGTEFCLRLAPSGGSAVFDTDGTTSLCRQITGIGAVKDYRVTVSN